MGRLRQQKQMQAAPCGIASRPQNTTTGVCGFLGVNQCSVFILVKSKPAFDQIGNNLLALFTQDPDRIFIHRPAVYH